MYYTGINPLTGKKVYVPTTYEEKSEQRALLQFNKPDNAAKVRSALIKAGREDLIGFGGNCLVKPERQPHFEKKSPKNAQKGKKDGKKPQKTPKTAPKQNKRSDNPQNKKSGKRK